MPFRQILILLVVAVLTCIFYQPPLVSDSPAYARDAAEHAISGAPEKVWEFGHLIWRPWGAVGYLTLGPLFERYWGDTPQAAAYRFLMLSSMAGLIASIYLLFRLLNRQLGQATALLTSLALLGTFCVLTYGVSGASYIAGFFWLMLSITGITQAAEGYYPRACSILAGIAFALAALCWFPYVTAGLGALALFYFWPSLVNQKNLPPVSWRQTYPYFLGSLALVFTAVLAYGAWAHGVRDRASFLFWTLGTNQREPTLNAVRFLTGWPRGFFDLGNDPILLKRLLLRDPYSPVSLPQLLRGGMVLKLSLAYIGTFALLAGLVQKRKVLSLVAAGILPVILFAIFLFEPSSPERYLPGYPFLFLGMAFVVKNTPHKAIRWVLIGFLLSLPLTNLITAWTRESPLVTLQRQTQLQDAIEAPAGARVYLVTLQDELHHMVARQPLNKQAQPKNFSSDFIVMLGTSLVPSWRKNWAQESIEAWDQGREVWISARLLAPRPDPLWLWVEGDDRRVAWTDFPKFFSGFSFDKQSPGTDGFHRLGRNAANLDSLRQIAATN